MNVRSLNPVFDLKLPAVTESGAAANTSVLLWSLAALSAIAIHVGAIAFCFAHPAADPDDDLGAPAIEIGLELAAPHLEPTDLPPGPEAEDSAASPAVVEQKAAVEESDLPKAQPSETEDPDRLVAPDDSKKPKEDDPKIKAVEAMPSTEAAASEAAAPPISETAQESPRSTAPTQGTGDSARRVRMTWQKELNAYLNKHLRYPSGEARRNVEVDVRFSLDRMGHVLLVEVVKSSGSPAFDEAALAMVRRSDPVPPAPPLVADEGLSFTLPVIFRAKGPS
jgi:TonB family protein